MSRTKIVVIDGHSMQVWDDAHDIVLAVMAEAGQQLPEVPQEWLQSWRQQAGIPDVAFSTAEELSEGDRVILASVLSAARELLVERGDVTEEQVRRWQLGDGLIVCGGTLRIAPVTVSQLLQVISAYEESLGSRQPSRQTPVLGAPPVQS